MSVLLDYLDIVMFAVLCAAILAGYPVAFTIAGIAVLFAGLGWLLGVFDLSFLGALPQRLFGIMTNNVLIAIPLFVFMGVVLERSRIAEDLLEEMSRLFGKLRGGLAVSVILVGALLAASTGIVGATVVTMALIAMPAMLRNGYDARLTAGTVCTAGTLGQIIPPSTLLIILSDVMSSSYQQAQFKLGKFTVETISVGQIFAAALIPGLVLVAIYILYVLIRAFVQPASAPAMPRDLGEPVSVARIGQVLLPPVLLIVAVLGSILGGIATPTEAAAVGAIGAVLLAGHRLSTGRARWSVLAGAVALGLIVITASVTTIRVQRADAGFGDWMLAAGAGVFIAVAAWGIFTALKRLTADDLLASVCTKTMTISAMIFATIIGASVFSLVFRGLGGDEHIEQVIGAMPGGETGALIFVMVQIFILGFFLDFIEISVIILPVVAPVLMVMGHDPVWLSVLIAINLQTSFLTPPFGFSLFYLRGAAPPEVTTGQIYAGVMPYIVLQIIGIAAIWMIPGFATWLPTLLFGQ